MTKAIVCGGRNYGERSDAVGDRERQYLRDVLQEQVRYNGVTEFAQGGANGADRQTALWCFDEGIPCRTFHAAWAQHGRAAGPIRNQEMLDTFQPDVVIVFPGGRGTADMENRAVQSGVRVIGA